MPFPLFYVRISKFVHVWCLGSDSETVFFEATQLDSVHFLLFILDVLTFEVCFPSINRLKTFNVLLVPNVSEDSGFLPLLNSASYQNSGPTDGHLGPIYYRTKVPGADED